MFGLRSLMRLVVSLPPSAAEVAAFIETMRIEDGIINKRTFLERNSQELSRLLDFVNHELAKEHGRSIRPITRLEYWLVFNCEASLAGRDHDEGEKGVLPLPSNIMDWNGPSSPAWDSPMSIERNLFHYALYIGQIKNKRMMPGVRLYAHLFELPPFNGNITRTAKLVAGIIHGYFGSSAYNANRPSHDALVEAYARDQELPAMLAGSGFKKLGALLGRQGNIEEALAWFDRQPTPEQRRVVRDGPLYAEPSLSAPTVLLRRGAIVTVISTQGGWVEITHGAANGFVQPTLLAPIAMS